MSRPGTDAISLYREVDPQEIAELRQAYRESLTAPLDGMWDMLAAQAQHREISLGGERAGYLCVDGEGQLLQLFLLPAFMSHGPEVFRAAADLEEVRTVLASTADPLGLSLALDRAQSVKVHTLLYEDGGEPTVEAQPEAGVLERVAAAQQPEVEAAVRVSLPQDPGEWLTGYLGRLISRGELYALRADGEILGTGELRVSDTQPPFADLGVIVAPDHRRRGLATEILRRLKDEASRAGLRSICSTTVENLGAQKAIRRAGFVSRHRLVEVEL